MDDNDLIEIGIIQALHRDAILRAAQSLPYRTPKLTHDQIQQLSIAKWLAFIHLKQYIDIFHNNGLTELRKIRNIWEVELETMLEIDKCGHRRRILYSLSDFNQRDSMIVSDNSDVINILNLLYGNLLGQIFSLFCFSALFRLYRHGYQRIMLVRARILNENEIEMSKNKIRLQYHGKAGNMLDMN